MSPHQNAERLPLSGVRIADLTQVWAGPYATRWLADMGAEVIKVEATKRLDPERRFGGQARSPYVPNYEPGEFFYNRAARFNQVNSGKLGITLDLSQSEGLDLFKRLVRVSDVVVENYSAGVMDRLGLGYEALQALKPDIIMLSMPGFGSKGPEAHFRAYGPIQEAMSGLTSLTGYAPGAYLETNEFYSDPVNGAFAASVLLAALYRRRRSGRGVYVDMAQRESLIACMPEIVIEYSMNGRIVESTANGHPYKAPHGCYRCKGEDSWLVLAVGTDQEWQALCECMGRPELADNPSFATPLARLENRAELDGLIEAWTREQDHYDLMHRLQAMGVPAHAVLNIEEVLSDPHFAARGFIESVPSPWTGEHVSFGVPVKLPGLDTRIRSHAPGLGEHNSRVLEGLLGLTRAEMQVLEEKGVIGDVPDSVRQGGAQARGSPAKT